MPTTDDVMPALRNLKPVPTALLVWCAGDDEPKRVAVANVRNRWARVAAVLAQLEWRRIEAHDKAGGVLGAYALDDDGAGDAPAASGAGLTIREREIGELVLLSFKQAHAMFQGMFGSLISSVRGQLESMTATQRQLTTSYERLMLVQRETMHLQAGEAGGDDSGLAEVVRTLVQREARKDAAPERKPADKSGKKSAASVR